jgi:hypothetical protein
MLVSDLLPTTFTGKPKSNTPCRCDRIYDVTLLDIIVVFVAV